MAHFGPNWGGLGQYGAVKTAKAAERERTLARIRTIKPEFFTSEDIVALSPVARLLYIALWCEADREGRMVWRPATFKLRYFPGDKVNITGLCGELVRKGLVVLYGQDLAYIPKFHKHQHVNPREAASSLPIPDASVTRADASNLDVHAQVGREGKEGKGKEGEVDACSTEHLPAGKVNGNAVAYIPTNDGSEFGISAEQVSEFEKLFPAVDIRQTLNEIRAWNLAKPERRKTRRGVLSHVTTWLQKEQNRGP